MQVLKGIPVASGVAIAKPFLVEREGLACPLRRVLSDAEVERDVKLFRDAIAHTAAGIRKTKERLERRIGKGHGAILDAHLMMLKDPLFVDATIDLVRRDRVNVGWAFYQSMEKLSKLVASVGDAYLRERSNDVEDVGWQVIRYLSGVERKFLRQVREPVVIVADELTPSETSDLPRDHVVGFATMAGSRTSHTAIIAQALEIPAVVGVTGLRDVAVGEGCVILDGAEGLLILDPDEDTLERYRRQQKVVVQRRKDLRKLTTLKTETTDGHAVELLANLELPVEVPAALKGGAEGVGLFRTEFLFLNRDDLPDEDEQYEWYRKVVHQMAPRPVVIRTMDVGGDKFMRAAGEAREMNPFLGLRGIRLSLAHRDLFRTQLRAIMRASAHGRVEVMFPMISAVEEFRQASAALEEVVVELRSEKAKFDPSVPVGAMIETPSAAMVSDTLAREAKFFSIGTNDLIQYAIAVDRGNQSANYLYQPLHPAILRLIRMVIDNAHAAGIPVTVCGEIAADPLAGSLLLGLGVDALSVSPVSLIEAKRLIRSASFAEAKAVVQEALTLPTAQTVRELVAGRLGARVTASS